MKFEICVKGVKGKKAKEVSRQQNSYSRRYIYHICPLVHFKVYENQISLKCKQRLILEEIYDPKNVGQFEQKKKNNKRT